MKRWSTSYLVVVIWVLWRASATVSDCPRYVKCSTGGEGLGDQLEHYIYCVHVGVLLGAEVVVEGFEDGGHVGGARGHHEYLEVVKLLGVQPISRASVAVTLPNESFTEQHVTFRQVLNIRDSSRTNNYSNPCRVVYLTDIRSCNFNGDDWCDNGPTFDAFVNTYSRLRRNQAKHDCMKLGLGFHDRGASGSTINIAWHIRTGDRCIHCNNVSYFNGVYTKLLEVPSILHSHSLAIDSTDAVAWLWKEKLFNNTTSRFHSQERVINSVCRFITADVLITSGSSFAPMIAAFLPPLSPVVVEEQRKEALGKGSVPFASHFFRPHEAVLMDEGRIRMTSAKFVTFLESHLREKIVREKNYSPVCP